jgi:hypothetical protein
MPSGWRPLLGIALSISAAAYLRTFTRQFTLSFRNMSPPAVPLTQAEWKEALNALPDTPDNIPAFFFAHGSPMLAHSEEAASRRMSSLGKIQGPNGPLAQFLKDFGPALLHKYKPKGILVYSAHWETTGERLGMHLD